MVEKKIISILIPTYNCKNYIENCINHIKVKAENMDKIEIIVIDDGSTDGTRDVLKKYKFLNYIKTRHNGIANSRNVGIKKANGDYILFIDSDDYINDDLLDNLLYEIKNVNPDIIRFGANVYNDKSYKSKDRFNTSYFGIYTGKEAIYKWSNKDEEWAVIWLYCIKKDLFNGIKFKKNKVHEDFGTVPIIIHKSKKILSMDFIGYNYIKRENSIIEDHNDKNEWKKSCDYLFQYDLLRKYFYKNEKDNLFNDFFINDIKKRMPEKLRFLSSEKLKKRYINKLKKRNININNSYSFIDK